MINTLGKKRISKNWRTTQLFEGNHAVPSQLPMPKLMRR